MAFDDYSNPVKPVRKIVSGDYGRDVLLPAGDRDPRALSYAAELAIRELYRNADEAGVRMDGWTVTFSLDKDSLYGESLLTATATHAERKRLRLTADQMEAEIMGLLSKRRDD